MIYDITKKAAPTMPRLGKGTECIKILLSQASKFMYEPLVPMLFPILCAHMCGAEFQYPDLTWKKLYGQMANLVAESGGDKSQLSHIVEAKITLLFSYSISKSIEEVPRNAKSQNPLVQRVVWSEEVVDLAGACVHVTHHHKKPRMLQVKVRINVYYRVIAQFYTARLVFLYCKLSNCGAVVWSVIFRGIAKVGTKVAT